MSLPSIVGPAKIGRTLLRGLKESSLIKVPVETSLRRIKLISLTQVSIGTWLRLFKLVGLTRDVATTSHARWVVFIFQNQSLKKVIYARQFRNSKTEFLWPYTGHKKVLEKIIRNYFQKFNLTFIQMRCSRQKRVFFSNEISIVDMK